jgi:L-alanine-DL-glutamate epimerase-like enolase superfamily enzyme
MTRIRSVEAILMAEPFMEREDEWVTAPMDVFREFGDPRRSTFPPEPDPPGTPRHVIVRVTTEDGVEGYGSVGLGSPAAKVVIDHHLAPHVTGQRIFDVELIWERMFRSTLNIGRKGLVLEAISAVDIAVWDALGKIVGQPVYNLLGGRTHERLRAYVSENYARSDLAEVRREAADWAAKGFTALKMRAGYGPTDGEVGKRKNYDLVATVRDAVGDDVELMIDAYMGWNVRYAIDMIRRLEEFNLAWVEEPVIPEDVDGYIRIRSAVNTPISGGEHEFTRFGYRDLLRRGAVDIVQPDVNRMGGITEARKVWALASSFNVDVIPHSHQAHNAHLIAAHLNSPLIEWFPHEGRGASYTFYFDLFEGEPEVDNGYMTLSERPGLGIALKEDVFTRWALPSQQA